eukprot:scaffold48448_cov18-Tisochrysis_lutea.AAC.1
MHALQSHEAAHPSLTSNLRISNANVSQSHEAILSPAPMPSMVMDGSSGSGSSTGETVAASKAAESILKGEGSLSEAGLPADDRWVRREAEQ